MVGVVRASNLLWLRACCPVVALSCMSARQCDDCAMSERPDSVASFWMTAASNADGCPERFAAFVFCSVFYITE